MFATFSTTRAVFAVFPTAVRTFAATCITRAVLAVFSAPIRTFAATFFAAFPAPVRTFAVTFIAGAVLATFFTTLFPGSIAFEPVAVLTPEFAILPLGDTLTHRGMVRILTLLEPGMARTTGDHQRGECTTPNTGPNQNFPVIDFLPIIHPSLLSRNL